MNRLDLCGTWELTGEDGRRFSAAVPGTVLGTLLDHGAISDPFDGMNEEQARAETRKTWRFERTFSVDAEQLSTACADLVFEGLDTLAEITLNGELLAKTDNMHRIWRFPVKERLLEGNNTICVKFLPALDYTEAAAKANPEVTDPGGSGLRGTWALRKAHYMFGWDWGPRLPDAGIWRKTEIQFYDARLEEIRIRQEHTRNVAGLLIDVRTGAERVAAELTDPEGNPAGAAEALAGETIRMKIPEPKLWWPNGLGEQPLYTLRLKTGGTGIGDETALRIGLRTMTVSREKDEWGESFALCCNGTPFFAMGADYIPEDSLLARMNREKTARLLKDCRDSHFNVIRVWGGGVYPDDGFFDLCDELGLVVWQDLMFACNTYRLTEDFRENIRREAEDNVRRIRHHASLGLICGNNEMETAWVDWEQVKHQPEYLKKDYLEQFEQVLQEVCRREAPQVFYWPSSPSSGGGFDDPNGLDRGDVHDWSVWHGRRPFSDFTERFPRFCSEFGFESFPCMDTLKTFVHREQDMNPFSRVMESHQKCLDGNGTMLYYLSRNLPYPFSMEKLVHASQYLQAEAVKAGVEHWRRNRGRCMGAVYWQLNDCWPVASWAGIDSLGRWKALQYMAGRFFAPTLVSLKREDDGWAVYVSNETRESFRGRAACIFRDSRGRRLEEAVLETECPAMGAVRAGCVKPEGGEAPAVIQVVLEDAEGRVVSENEILDTLPKYFPFEPAEIRVKCEGKAVSLTADTFCLGVELQAGDTRFSDNWLSLYPGEPRTVFAEREVREEEIRVLKIG